MRLFQINAIRLQATHSMFRIEPLSKTALSYSGIFKYFNFVIIIAKKMTIFQLDEIEDILIISLYKTI